MGQSFERIEKSLLQRFFGVLDIAAHAQGHVIDPGLVGGHNFGQGGLIALLGAFN